MSSFLFRMHKRPRLPSLWGMMKRVGMAALLLGTLALSSCSATDGDPEVLGSDEAGTADSSEQEKDSESSDAQNLEVRSGFTSGVDSIGTRYVSAGALITNPNPDRAAYDVSVLFNLVAKSGDVLDSSSENVTYIGPGATVPVAPLQIGFDVEGTPAKLEVSVTGNFSDDDGPKGLFGGDAAILEFKSGSLRKSDFGTELSAQVSNNTEAVADDTSWDCVYLQGNKIVGGSRSSILDAIPPGGTVQFGESLTLDLVAQRVECRVIAEM